jgi:hypothetical protein
VARVLLARRLHATTTERQHLTVDYSASDRDASDSLMVFIVQRSFRRFATRSGTSCLARVALALPPGKDPGGPRPRDRLEPRTLGRDDERAGQRFAYRAARPGLAVHVRHREPDWLLGGIVRRDVLEQNPPDLGIFPIWLRRRASPGTPMARRNRHRTSETRH